MKNLIRQEVDKLQNSLKFQLKDYSNSTQKELFLYKGLTDKTSLNHAEGIIIRGRINYLKSQHGM